MSETDVWLWIDLQDAAVRLFSNVKSISAFMQIVSEIVLVRSKMRSTVIFRSVDEPEFNKSNPSAYCNTLTRDNYTTKKESDQASLN